MTFLRKMGYCSAVLGFITLTISMFVKLKVTPDQLLQMTLLGLIAIAVDDIRKQGQK